MGCFGKDINDKSRDCLECKVVISCLREYNLKAKVFIPQWDMIFRMREQRNARGILNKHSLFDKLK